MTTPDQPRQGSPVAELLMTSLLGCVCTALAEAGRRACCCMWYRGQNRPPMDKCDCKCEGGQGIAWGRIVERSNTQADAAVGRVVHFGGTCPPGGTQQWTVEVGVYRCIPDRPEGRTCDEQTNAGADGAWDDDLLWKGVVCCEIPGIALTPQSVVTAGPSGGCVGSVLTLFASVPDTVPREEEPPPAVQIKKPAPRNYNGTGRSRTVAGGWA